MRFLLLILLTVYCATGCSSSTGSDGPATPHSEWLIDQNEVVDGGPGKDGIPSIDEPRFSPVQEAGFMQDERLVIAVSVNGELKIYPHQILDWHEVVNDTIGKQDIAITYCPLTGTGMAWNRTLSTGTTDFGVSGLLYRNNLIAYDRATDSYWSQMQVRSITGEAIGDTLTTFPVFETTWATARDLFHDAPVLNTQTGYGRSYGSYAYGKSYLTNHDDILFPVKNPDRRLPNKTRVHAVIPGSFTGESADVRAYVLEEYTDSVKVINDDFKGNAIVFAGNAEINFGVSFSRTATQGEILEFEAVQNQLPVIMKDQNGNHYNVFGVAVSGPDTGRQLQHFKSYNGYWFAVADFFVNTCIYPEDSKCTDVIDK